MTTNLPGFCPAVWRPDVCRPLVALGPVPLSWSSGTLATERFYPPSCRKASESEPYLVTSFTNALAFPNTTSTPASLRPVRPSSALKSAAYVVAIGIPLELRGRSRQRYLFTLLSSSTRKVRWSCRSPQRRETTRRRVLLIPPSGGPTQAGTTPNVSFRAILSGVEPECRVAMDIAL